MHGNTLEKKHEWRKKFLFGYAQQGYQTIHSNLRILSKSKYSLEWLKSNLELQ